MVDEDMSLIFLMLKFLLICFEDCGYLERKRRVSEDSCEVCEIIIGMRFFGIVWIELI